ncbi:biopolymer transport protein ExbD [Balnearium lithotrophicum]|uniref:Biopolymer transport protein ExbD n=1 Tax=Balnearium lithotrophicum TaxID=223788 RepID=A0A521BMZ6_9BACT|nr:biopolymer transporter ExbD [Balnearium lithotrophicum]SMO48527.1 biopolymer transport protein ExbD [Balnearium lithotrophicum]
MRKIRKPKSPITSLIDISLLLLVYFMLITNYSQTNVVEVNPPSMKNCETIEQEKTVFITITKNGKIFLDGKEVNYNQLSDLLKNYNPKTTFIIKADKETAFKNVLNLVDKLKSLNLNYFVAVERTEDEK